MKVLGESGILEVRYAGEVSYELRNETLDLLERALAGRDSPRLLINYTSAWPAPKSRPGAVANFGAKLGRAQYVFGARVALLNAPFEIDAQTAEASMQAGFLFRQFNDRQQAIDWLSLSS